MEEILDLLTEAPLFHDRREAGRRLAERLPPGLEGAVVVGLARGGVEVASEIAEALAAPLDVLAVRKVRHPFQPEYALGAVTPGEDGLYLRGGDGLTDAEIGEAVARARLEAAQLDRRLHGARSPLELRGRPAVIVDDGLATGATMIAAARWARARDPTRLVAALPVAAAQSASVVRPELDELVCVLETRQLIAVGIWYEWFPPLDDDDVDRLLDAAAARPPAGEPG